MREKRRYIAFEATGEAGTSDVLRAIHPLRTYRTASRRAPRLVIYNETTRRGLLRCGHLQVDEIKGFMSGVGKNRERGPSLRVIGVSGTIKAARRKFLKTAQARD